MNRDILAEHLIHDEGLRLKPYIDTAGKCSLGVGRNLDDVGISRYEAMFLLENDVERMLAEVSKLSFWHKLNEARQLVIANMCFNLGIVRLKKFKRMFTALSYENYDEAANEMLDSKWARRDVGSRALRLADMMRSGEIPDHYGG